MRDGVRESVRGKRTLSVTVISNSRLPVEEGDWEESELDSTPEDPTIIVGVGWIVWEIRGGADTTMDEPTSPAILVRLICPLGDWVSSEEVGKLKAVEGRAVKKGESGDVSGIRKAGEVDKAESSEDVEAATLSILVAAMVTDCILVSIASVCEVKGRVVSTLLPLPAENDGNSSRVVVGGDRRVGEEDTVDDEKREVVRGTDGSKTSVAESGAKRPTEVCDGKIEMKGVSLPGEEDAGSEDVTGRDGAPNKLGVPLEVLPRESAVVVVSRSLWEEVANKVGSSEDVTSRRIEL